MWILGLSYFEIMPLSIQLGGANLSLGARLKKQLELNIKDGEKVKVTPVGEVVGLDGREFKIDSELLLKSILENDLHIPLDINHNFDEAVGWFEKNSFETREDGIYAMLEPTTKGAELIANKSYRYLSPVFVMGSNNTVIGLDSVGLVNRPNLLNKELNEKEKNNLDKELEELKQKNKSLEDELAKLKSATTQTQTAPTTQQEQGNQTQELKDGLEVVQGALKEMNKKLSLLAGKTDFQENDKKVTLSANEKKVASLLGISEDDFIKSKEQN